MTLSRYCKQPDCPPRKVRRGRCGMSQDDEQWGCQRDPHSIRACRRDPAGNHFLPVDSPWSGLWSGHGGFFLNSLEHDMNYISEIPEGQAIICSNGVFRQVKIAVRKDRIYARYGAGYVRLTQGGGSSHPKVRWYEIDAGDGKYTEKGGAVLYHGSLKAAA